MKRIVSQFFSKPSLVSVLSKRVHTVAVFIIYSVCIPLSVFASLEVESKPPVSVQKGVVLECVCRDSKAEIDPYAPQADMVFSVMQVEGTDVKDVMKKAHDLCSSSGGNDLDCINVSAAVECSCSTEMGNGERYSDRLIGLGENYTEAFKDMRMSCDEVIGEEAVISQCIYL